MLRNLHQYNSPRQLLALQSGVPTYKRTVKILNNFCKHTESGSSVNCICITPNKNVWVTAGSLESEFDLPRLVKKNLYGSLKKCYNMLLMIRIFTTTEISLCNCLFFPVFQTTCWLSSFPDYVVCSYMCRVSGMLMGTSASPADVTESLAWGSR